MKDRFISLIVAFIPSAIITLFSEWANGLNIKIKILLFLMIFLAIWAFIEFILFVWNGNVRSKIDLWRYGKIKGLWIEKGLIRQIEKGFRESDDIKIKVTRGYDLFREDEKYGFIKSLNELKKKNSNTNIRFLLIVPCFKEQHVQQRYERHVGIKPYDFLETWYKSVSKMKEYSSEYLSMNVRFYMGGHARWRFYVFSRQNGRKSSVFLSDYDKNTAGSEHPMYKIIKKSHNIASFMTSYFDDLWDSALTPLQLFDVINQEKCIRQFCGNCKKEDKCSDCPHSDCNYKEQCKKLVKKYESELKGFNVK